MPPKVSLSGPTAQPPPWTLGGAQTCCPSGCLPEGCPSQRGCAGVVLHKASIGAHPRFASRTAWLRGGASSALVRCASNGRARDRARMRVGELWRLLTLEACPVAGKPALWSRRGGTREHKLHNKHSWCFREAGTHRASRATSLTAVCRSPLSSVQGTAEAASSVSGHAVAGLARGNFFHFASSPPLAKSATAQLLPAPTSAMWATEPVVSLCGQGVRRDAPCS